MENDRSIKNIQLENDKIEENDLNKIDISFQNNDCVRGSKFNKKNRSKKICMSLSRNEEKKINEATEYDDKLSIFVIVIILACCFVVGIYLGWLLYNIAIS